jgi:hypothetical protein
MVESERRKPHVDEGNFVAIKLGDGQLWRFPKPRLRVRPVLTDGKVDIGFGATYGKRHDALIEMMADAADDETRLAALMTLAWVLLADAYDLAHDELDQLLSLSLEAPDWMKVFVLVVTGRFGRSIATR